MPYVRKTLAVICAAALLLLSGTVVTHAAGSEENNIETKAEYAIIVNANSGYELYSKNADAPVYCAFLPRLMTCILLIESGIDLDTKVTITSEMLKATPEKSSAGLASDNNISLRDLMKCVLVGNSQECSVAIAMTVGGTLNDFVAKMNIRAAELGALNTVFTNVTGYYSSGTKQKTTLRDAAKIITQALTLDYIEDYSNKRMAEFTVNNTTKSIFTKNLLVDTYSEYYSKKARGLAVSGNKEQGFALASVAANKNMRLVSIAIGSTSFADIYADVTAMLLFSINEYSYRTIIQSNSPATEIRVVLGKDRDFVTLIAAQTLEVSLPQSVKDTDIQTTFNIPDSVDAPVVKGQKLGTATYTLNGSTLGTVELLAQTDVALDVVGMYTKNISAFFANKYVWTVIIIIVVVVVFYSAVVFIANKKRIREELRKKHNRIKITEKKKQHNSIERR